MIHPGFGHGVFLTRAKHKGQSGRCYDKRKYPFHNFWFFNYAKISIFRIISDIIVNFGKLKTMKRLVIFLAAALVSLSAAAQDSFLSHMFLPVDAGVTFATHDAIGGAFYMRASLEYRPNIHKGLFVLAELDTHTNPYSSGGVVWGNVQSGDAAFTDILIGPGWRFMLSDSFKIALALQGGTTNMAIKEVSSASGTPGMYDLKGLDEWQFAAKASAMFEYYLNPSFDLFLGVGLPATFVHNEQASAHPLVLFPTLSLGFNMALE